MKWYEGDIAQAVSMSKRKNAVFVVYVEGKDDISTKLTSQINESNVTTQMESETFVAIKIEAGTVTHNQFAAIYKNVPVPSLFFIGKNGNPIDTILDSSNGSDLEERINKVIEAHTGISPTSSRISTNTSATPSEVLIESESTPMDTSSFNENDSNVTEFAYSSPLTNTSNIISDVSFGALSASSRPGENVSTSFLDAEKKVSQEEMKISQEEMKVSQEEMKISQEEMKISQEEIKISQEKMNVSQENDDGEEEELVSQEEKIQRAKELLEQKRELKKQEEEAIEKLKEIERRKMGKDVQEMRRRQQDQELKNLMEERQRTKNEEKAARDRILAQIASDKADRAARYGTSPPASVANAAEPVNVVVRPTTSHQNMARLQFRLPDGTTNTHEFDSSDTLQEVRNYITLNLKPPFKHFSLSTTFPRKEFTEDDNEENLKDLELCPTSVILILPGNAANTVSTNAPGGFMSLIWFFLSPIMGIFDYFRSFFVRPRNVEPTGNGGNRRPASDAVDTNNLPFSFFRPMKRKATETTAVRRQGNSNIHLLRDKKDSDDENNTWNGNSTQQM